MKKQRKLFFYTLTLILTIAIAITASALSFSSDFKESGPKVENELKISQTTSEKETTESLVDDYSKTVESPEKTETPNTASEKEENIKKETKEPEKQIETTVKEEIKPVIETPKEPEAPVKNNPVFQVTDYISTCDNVNCFTSKDAERGIVQYQNTFYYGHSTIAFDRLKTVYVGEEIIVKDINGAEHHFKIAERMVKEKSYLNGAGKTDGFTAGVYSATYNGNKYSASFMTCGNGSNNDSNYRLILFAYEV